MDHPLTLATAQRPTRSLRTCTQGAAIGESLVMLPFFILLWGGLIYVHRTYEEGLAASAKARQCAWIFSLNNCEDPPPGCDLKLDSTPVNVPTSHDKGGAVQTVSGSSGQLPDSLRSRFDWLSIFGQKVTAINKRSVDRPGPLGSGTTDVKRTTIMMCNAKKEDIQSMLGDMFNHAANQGGLGNLTSGNP